MGNVQTAGPNELLVISGSDGSRKFIKGGWGWVSLNSHAERLSLEMFTLDPKCQRVETKEGKRVTVQGVAHFKVLLEPTILKMTCDTLLGKSEEEIKESILKTFEGHFSTVLSQLTIEAVLQDRHGFAKSVIEAAAPDVARMGMEILSFAITDVKDEPKY